MHDKIITELLELWYAVIGPQHHKDRDCWWTVEKVFCCYRPMKYRLVHHGYIINDINESFKTYSEAADRLVKILIDAITEECRISIEMHGLGDDSCDLPVERAREILEKLTKLKKDNKL